MRVIDLFAGCGGMTAGFAAEGFEPVLAVEWNKAAAATYAANFGEGHVRCTDIALLAASDVPEADVVIGGPPCQGFSNLGTRDPKDPRNRLWREYVRVLETVKPQTFVIENVAQFSRSHEFKLLLDEVKRGRLQAYDLTFGVLNAADFGVPQRRSRTIVVGSRLGTPRLPQATHAHEPGLLTERWRTVRDAIGNVPLRPDTTQLPDSVVAVFGEEIPGIFKGLQIHIGRNPTERSLERYRHIRPGGGRFDLPEHLLSDCWRNKPTGTTDVMGRMRWDAPSLTIRTEFYKPEKGQYLHPAWDEDPTFSVDRPITHYEASLLQDFPSDYEWCGSKIEIARQIGNAVPVALARAVARSVRTQLEAEPSTST